MAPAVQPRADPTEALVSAADAELKRGESELKQGHLGQAREAFDRAVSLYLEAPGGAYAGTRRAEAYRRTLEAIHLYDLEAIAAGDGFDEALAEPAAIDEVATLPVEPAPASPETRRAAEAAVQSEQNDLPIELNDAVLACIDLYQGRLREWFSAALARGGRYLPYIREVFASEGIPQDLAYAALVESAFRTGALSRAKARGVWQFIPATGRRYGLHQDWWVDERSDPEKATRAAAKYLKTLYGLFGDWNLALAGYNAGEARIQRAIARYGTSDFWELARQRDRRALRPETRNYVPMIHAAVVVAKAPDGYGFVIEPEPALAYDSVTVDGPVDLRTVAECAGCALDDVRRLNPALRRMATPSGRSFDVKVPEGSGDTVRACLDKLPAEKRVAFRTHIVGRGQTLASIARQYGTRAEDIAQANNIRSARRLARGTELIIPVPARARAATRDAPAARAASATRGGDAVRITHRVRAGDTLSSIAERYGTTVAEIKAWNRLRGTRIAAGGRLTIFAAPQ
jgi:membrane-bound lytic murein transglycosylase D